MNIKGCCLVALAAIMCSTPEIAHAEASSACDSSLAGIADTPPPAELAAILNYDCAEDFLNKNPDTAAEMAVNMGYPSLLLRHETDARAIELMAAAAADGDRGFFAYDPEILYDLENLDVHSDLLDFVRTAKESVPIGDVEISSDYLNQIALWQSPVNARLLVGICSESDCSKTKTTCPSDFGLMDKIRLAAGEIDIYEAISRCDISPEWIISLRRAGIVDTSCTSIMQINLALQNPERLPDQCFGLGQPLSEYDAIGSADYSRYIRQSAASGELLQIDQASIDMIWYIFPDTADFLLENSSE